MINKGVIHLHLRNGKSNGRNYLSIVQGYRDKETGKARSKVVKSLGYLDDLRNEHEDPVAHFKAVVAEMNRQEGLSICPGWSALTPIS